MSRQFSGYVPGNSYLNDGELIAMDICHERVTYPATVARIVEQAAQLGIPEDAELIARVEYDEQGPEVFFKWYEPQPKGRHHKRGTDPAH